MSKKRVKAKLVLWNGQNPPNYIYMWQIEPATADAYEQMVEQVYGATMEACRSSSPGYSMSSRECGDVARAALRAIGITPPKKGRT